MRMLDLVGARVAGLGGLLRASSKGVRAGFAFVALSVGLACAGPGLARAADAPVLKAKSVWAYDWTGFYVGGHVGYSRGRVDATVAGAFPTHETARFGALYGGVHGGYKYFLPFRVVLGREAHLFFFQFLGRGELVGGRAPTPTHGLRG